MFKLKKESNYNSILTVNYYLFSILRNILLYLPVLVLFLEMTLNNSVKVGTVLLVKSITVAILEIPMGYVSDMISRKLSLKCSIFLNIFSLLLFIFNPTFWTLIIAEILFGISETLSSGSDVSLIYDNYKYKNRLNLYEVYQRNEIFILSVVLALSFFLGSIIYNINHVMVFLIPIICLFLSFFILLRIPEYPYKESNAPKLSFLDNIKKTLSVVLNSNKGLVNHIIYGVLLNGLFTSVYMLLFPIVLNNSTQNKMTYGIIYAVAVMLIGFGARTQGKVKSQKIEFLPITVSIVFLCSFFINNLYFFVISLLFMRFIWGIFNSYFIIQLNHLIDHSSMRATFFSFYSSLVNLFSGTLIFILGIFLEKSSNFRYLFFILGICFFVLFLIYSSYKKKRIFF
ncbi:MFS transporter [Enterococcus sp. CWB-B31]|uniref:MFS transporter n=1 Tax=Enterococcus sp. CWB-B31 TaxID=2885159 RepID=UPI001E397766|nr:MFS transporter [Enterococcus sp. CWB-B31]MCB5954402.1 MFS transporter [Enterococcus sp. CWB-B31]